MKNTEIKLGNKARCIVTGFEGIVTGDCLYLNGCRQLCLKPKMNKEGKLEEGIWVDIGQIEYVDKGIYIESKETGGPQMDAPKC